MVFVNNQKFAWSESSQQATAPRPAITQTGRFFEIKKKGRPVSQCEKCRQLRQSRRVHSKCNCPQDEAPSRGLLLPSSSTKSRRYIPITPALPNGLRDVLPVSSRSFVPPDSRQRVDSLLNPCNCRSVWKCKCRAVNNAGPSSSSGPAAEPTGLATLARAAALCCSTQPTPSLSRPNPRKDAAPASKHQTSRPNSPNHHGSHKRPKHINTTRSVGGPDLPPILYDESSPFPSPSIPTFAVMPPMSTITSLAGSGCTCGFECACPGCVEHRGPEHADKDRPSCADGCGTCIDAHAGLALPGYEGVGASSSSSITSALTNSIIDQFLARAAALPAPPSNRKVGVDIDPMNVLMYPPGGGSGGMINLPKLECCGGQCSCPAGSCSCRKSCNGCCSEHRANKPSAARAHPSPAKSCCAVR
ncbi:Copper-fist domain-containing protein [Mycena venus]|uniref:Copper-fist domain-containing protein n=1 Tax=Mycena venus TaxID=2733690 RepID=A0A8H7CLC0_9AGAR|nr:Copper-fist domain-containing protein [Mycena venus]